MTVSNPGQALRVIFFKTLSGEEPVRAWLNSLSLEIRKEILIDIKTVQKGWHLGQLAGSPLVRLLDTALWEVQSNLKSGIARARVIISADESQIVLLHGFILRTARTPRREIKVARNRLKEWQSEA